MATAVVFPDIEAWLISYLRDLLSGRSEPYAADVFVGHTVPDTRAERMVIVRRDGGPRETVVTERARVGVQVWAGTEPDAADLAAMVRALVGASAGEGPVKRVPALTGPAAVADESDQPLRYLTAELTVRGSVLDPA